TLAMAVMIPVVALPLPGVPRGIGIGLYGQPSDPGRPPMVGNPFAIAITTLQRAAGSVDFWLLTLSFGICGVSTNGLIKTHLIAYCWDRGLSEITGARVPATLGAFSLVGAAASGWLCDRFNPRLLPGFTACAAFRVIPFRTFNIVSLSVFSVLYDLPGTV